MTFSLTVHAQSKVGTVNVNTILSKLPELTQVQKSMAEYNTKLETDLKTKLEDYQNKVNDYQAKVDTFSDVMKKTKEDELLRLQNEINQYRQNFTFKFACYLKLLTTIRRRNRLF